MSNYDQKVVAQTLEYLIKVCHQENKSWWTDKNGAPLQDSHLAIPAKIALIHSEMSEALEGARKDLDDEHLPQFKSIEVELADALIRIMDLAGAYNFRVHEALPAKLAYNANRADHKPENRALSNGKRY